jgi:putative endonuclease
MPWIVYMLHCADNTLYTGITTDMERRLAMHSNGTGAKYTRGRTPLKLIYTEAHETQSQALKRERNIKALSRSQKLQLIPPKPVKLKTPRKIPAN